MKSEIKVVAIVLVALIVFLSGFGLGASKGINITVKNDGAAAQQPVQQQQQVQQQVQQPVQQQQQAQQPQQQETTKAPAADTQETTKAPAADNGGASTGVKVPSTPAEIATAYNKAINDAKAYTGKVTLKKHDIINVGLADNAAADIINPVIQKLTATEPMEETFEGGKGTADNTRELNRWIIPGGGRQAAVTEAGLASATATPNPDGGYTMVITFVAEQSVFDGEKNTSEPVHHMTAMDPLNLGSLDLGSAIKITNATLTYPGATMTATVDAQGRLISLKQQLPLNGTGEGKAAFIPVSLQLSGSMDGNYEFIYA